MAERRYYWLKLKDDFFRQKPIKKLRLMDRGEIYTIVYLKMQLESLSNNGIIVFEGVGDSFSEELAFQIDEREEDVRATVEFLAKHGLLIQLSETENFLPQAVENTGSESSSAIRMRELRERESSQSSFGASQCDAREKREDKRDKREDKREDTCVSSCVEPETVSTPPVITLPLNDGTEYFVTVEQSQEWAGLYPAVDVIQQLRGMRGWLDANPQKRKTRRGIKKFINGWLSKEQDRGGSLRQSAKTTQNTPQARKSWAELAREMEAAKHDP